MIFINQLGLDNLGTWATSGSRTTVPEGSSEEFADEEDDRVLELVQWATFEEAAKQKVVE